MGGKGSGKNQTPMSATFVDKPKKAHKQYKWRGTAAEVIALKENSHIPNPLNLDYLAITEEAREAWRYVYSLRGYGEGDFRNRERMLRDGKEVITLFDIFCADIRNRNFVSEFERPDGSTGVMPIIPSQSNFARWLGIDRRNIGSTMRQYAKEEDLEEYKSALADILSEGAMMGIYQPSMTIFSLKNLCDWADKYEDRPKGKKKENQTVEEAQQLMATLGYKQLGETDG